jgi:predicted dehydrogenase
MAMTVNEAIAMTSLAEREGVQWMIGYMKQFDPGVRHFKRLLSDFRASGDMGDILSVSMQDYCAAYGTSVPHHVRRQGSRAHRYAEAPIAPDFVPGEYRAGYEYTVNVASHDINLLRSIFDDEMSATSLAVRHRGAQHMLFDAGGIPINLVVAPVDVGYWDQKLDVNFMRGRVSLTLPSPLARDRNAVVHVERAGMREEFRTSDERRVWAFEAQARVFVDAALSGVMPPNSGAECLADMTIIENLWKKMEFR